MPVDGQVSRLHTTGSRGVPPVKKCARSLMVVGWDDESKGGMRRDKALQCLNSSMKSSLSHGGEQQEWETGVLSHTKESRCPRGFP